MTSIELFLKQTQEVGPLHVWPMRWTGLSSLEYQVPPNIDQLLFREYDEGDGPEIGRIEVFNPADIPVLIPSGWVVGGDLLQVRVLDASEFITPLQSVLAKVSCVERGRWVKGKVLQMEDEHHSRFMLLAEGLTPTPVSGALMLKSGSNVYGSG